MIKRQGKHAGKQGKAIDWQEVRQRLDTTAGMPARGTTPERSQAILRARAEALAREPGRVEPGERLVVLEFLLAHERYGIEMSWIRETLPLKELTPVPGTPPFVLGLINVRGQIMSVIDIRKFFDLPEKGLTDLNRVIILHGRGMEFGILADAVAGIRTILRAELQPSLPTLTGIREEYLRGVTGERLAVLDAERLLGDTNIIVHDEIED
jgi:purine-binding chemotaxis protein CheW